MLVILLAGDENSTLVKDHILAQSLDRDFEDDE
jgi:hypothetical protein